MGITAGHEKLSLTLTEQRSRGGDVITAAKGQSLTVTAQETFSLTENTNLTVTAVADRFLGGEASIPLGTVRLSEGDWNPRLSFASETEIVPAMSFRTRAEMTDDEELRPQFRYPPDFLNGVPILRAELAIRGSCVRFPAGRVPQG